MASGPLNQRHRTIDAQQLKGIISSHAQWLATNKHDGARAILRGTDLTCHQELIGDVDLSHADLAASTFAGLNLSGCNFSGACLRSSDLRGVAAILSNFSGCDATHAVFVNANLERAVFREADLQQANLEGANLESSDCSQANLRRAKLSNANLAHAVLNRADISIVATEQRSPIRRILARFGLAPAPFTLDGCECLGTRFPAYSNDHWSVLRRSYTGSHYAILLLFTLAAFLPLMVQATLWATLSRIESSLPLPTIAARVAAYREDALRWHRKAEDVVRRARQTMTQDGAMPDALAREIDDLLAAKPEAELKPPKVEEWKVAEMLIGLPQGKWVMLLNLLLLLYHVSRAWVTYSIGRLRDEEDRTGVSPSLGYYTRWWKLHLVARTLQPFAWISLVINAYSALSSTVYVLVQ